MNTELPKKIRWNAAVSYALAFASLAFLTSKNPNFNHPFIKSHVKVAFWLHCLLLFMLYFMSYPFLRNIKIFTLSLNDIITAVLWILIFWALLYCSQRAYKWELVGLSHLSSGGKEGITLLKTHKIDGSREKEKALIILTHIPLFGYYLAAQNRENQQIQHIALLNLIITILCLIVAFFELKSIASLIFLSYIVWSMFISLRLIFADEYTEIDLSIIPAPEEKYILQKALLIYVKNIFDTQTFVELKTLRDSLRERHRNKEQLELQSLQELPDFQYSPLLLSVPLVNLLWLIYQESKEKKRIISGAILSLLLILILTQFWIQSPLFLIALIPFFYHAGYSKRKAHHMPYISDIGNTLSYLLRHIFRIWKKTRELQKKEVSWSFKSPENIETP